MPIPAGFRLESGKKLPDTHIHMRRFGQPAAPLVIVAGGISSGRRLCGAGGWWGDMVGAGAAIDLTRYSALGLDFSPLGDERVQMTPRTQARLVEIALDAIGVERAHAFVGASYGAMVGLAFAACAPTRLGRLCVISAAHRPSPLALAWRGVERRTVEFALEQGRPSEGLSLARQLAMITYRSGAEFEARFDRLVGRDGRSDLDRYLVSRGNAYADAMGAKRWLSLSEAIDRCCVTPEAVAAPTTLVACSSDQLVPFADMQELARRLPRFTALHAIDSHYGHDAFLKEPTALSPILASFLESTTHA